MTPVTTRLDRLDQYLAEGKIIRRNWSRLDEQGRVLVCLLAALAPECAPSKDPALCPADVMPLWLAHLTPWIDDAGSEEAWPAQILRYAALARRWHALSDSDWQRLEYTVRGLCVRDVIRQTPSKAHAFLSWCEHALCFCESIANGGPIIPFDFEGAPLFESSLAPRAEHLCMAVRAAVDVGAECALDAATSGGHMASPADRLIDQILTAIETACSAAEADPSNKPAATLSTPETT